VSDSLPTAFPSSHTALVVGSMQTRPKSYWSIRMAD
jgi:hypothetical protein